MIEGRERSLATPLRVPLEDVKPCNDGVISAVRDGRGTRWMLSTDPRYWAFSAQATFELPGVDYSARTISVGLDVKDGEIGVGWLAESGESWIVLMHTGVGNRDVRLSVPPGTRGGRLVFTNWTEGGRPGLGCIGWIEVLDEGECTPGQAALAAEEAGAIDVATAHYKAVLASDPSNIEAIAGLGRLRFVPRAQPLLDEMKRRSPPSDYCQVVVAIRNPCNYRCHYCVGAGWNNEPVNPLLLDQIRSYYETISAAGIGTSFECGGGEPTVHPQFSDALRLSARYGHVDFPSNNSQDPRRWLPREVAGQLDIRAALHPEGEAKINRYLDYAKFLLDAGCGFRGDFIVHPTRLHLVEYYAELFAGCGIPFLAIPFIGTYNGRSYPHAYTAEDQAAMEPFAPKNSDWGIYVRIASAVNRIRNFRGISCLSGHNSIYIDPNGRMHRCSYDLTPIKARMPKPEKCGVGNCGCGIPLEDLNFSVTGFWPRLSELDSLAHGLGYENAEAGVATEYIAQYDALMAAYGKDEFPE